MPAGVNRPNILFVMTDQQSADAMSCTGNPWLRTPAMDQLAARGVRFERAYCAHPLCSPQRSSLFTGLMPHQTGVVDNAVPFRMADDCMGLGTHLREAGYRCAYAGRGPQPVAQGFESLCGPQDQLATQEAVRFLGAGGMAPFCLAVSYNNPHNICEWARRQPLPEGAVEPAPPEQWPTLPANFAPAPFEAEAIRWHQAARIHPHPERRWSPDEWRRYLHAYYRMVEKVDGELGRVLEALDAGPYADNTVVIFTSDHGNGNAAHGWHQKEVFFEEVMRVPLLAWHPGMSRGGRIDERHLVSIGLDLFPTCAQLAGLPVPEHLPGLGLKPLLDDEGTGRVADWRRYIVGQTTLSMQGVPDKARHRMARMIRTDRYKYALYPMGRYREQLFDMHSDPGEMVNLAVSDRYADVLAEHRRLLAEWCRQSEDVFQVFEDGEAQVDTPVATG